jgi:hypothetical protein
LASDRFDFVDAEEFVERVELGLSEGEGFLG